MCEWTISQKIVIPYEYNHQYCGTAEFCGVRVAQSLGFC